MSNQGAALFGDGEEIQIILEENYGKKKPIYDDGGLAAEEVLFDKMKGKGNALTTVKEDEKLNDGIDKNEECFKKLNEIENSTAQINKNGDFFVKIGKTGHSTTHANGNEGVQKLSIENGGNKNLITGGIRDFLNRIKKKIVQEEQEDWLELEQAIEFEVREGLNECKKLPPEYERVQEEDWLQRFYTGKQLRFGRFDICKQDVKDMEYILKEEIRKLKKPYQAQENTNAEEMQLDINGNEIQGDEQTKNDSNNNEIHQAAAQNGAPYVQGQWRSVRQWKWKMRMFQHQRRLTESRGLPPSRIMEEMDEQV